MKFYNILKFGLLIFVAYVFVAFANGDKAGEDECNLDNEVFVADEVLVYKLYYNWKFVWIPAGEVKFEVKESDLYYDYYATGKTYESYDNFFKVRDYYYSRVDKKTLFPVNFVREIEEGKYTRYDSIVFNQNINKAVSHWGSKKENIKPYEFDLDGCMQDMLSILYYVRNYNSAQFKEGDNIPVKVFFDKEVFPLKVRYDGQEKKKKIKGLGKFNAMKFTPEVVAGYVFDEDTTMKLWVSDDNNKIPLLVESPVSVGSIKAVLKRYKNLKYPLTSQVE